MAPTLVTLVPKIITYPRAAIGAIAFCVQTTNHPEEFSVSFCSATLWSHLPGIVATARNLEQPTHHIYWILAAASIDTQVSYFDSLAKNAAVDSIGQRNTHVYYLLWSIEFQGFPGAFI